MTRRVVITGMGAVTPIGIGKQALWAGVKREQSAVRAITRFDASALRSRIAAEVPDFDPLQFLDARPARRMDRFAQFAVSSAQMALADAGLPQGHTSLKQAGVSIGSALGGIAQAEAEHQRLVQEGFAAVHRLIALSVYSGAGAANVSIYFGLRGPMLSNANSCTSGTMAIGEAFRRVLNGEADMMLAGGAEAPLSPLSFGAFDLIGALSRRNEDPLSACRPFDRDRDGFVMGEGAAILVLEELAHARRREATIYGEILGYGLTSDAHHMTVPRPDGSEAARAITLALSEADMAPGQLDYVNAHGSATVLNDRSETLALKLALGSAAARLPISSTKALHGHSLGASGAIECVISLLAMQHSWIPPTLNLRTPDSTCDLDYVPLHGRAASVRHVLTHSFGFGGSNAALVIGHPRPYRARPKSRAEDKRLATARV